MRTPTVDFREAISHLPDGATLIVHQVGWEDYARLLEDTADRPHLRVSYNCGKLEIMTPLPEHEEYARFIDDLVRVVAEALDLNLEKRGSATWKSHRLAKGVEPDACYYVAHADRIIGKRPLDPDSDPPPDIVVEIDITNESLGKFPTYAAFGVREIWRYDGEKVQFYDLAGSEYREVSESRSFASLTPPILAEALEQSKRHGQTVALRTFRKGWRRLLRGPGSASE